MNNPFYSDTPNAVGSNEVDANAIGLPTPQVPSKVEQKSVDMLNNAIQKQVNNPVKTEEKIAKLDPELGAQRKAEFRRKHILNKERELAQLALDEGRPDSYLLGEDSLLSNDDRLRMLSQVQTKSIDREITENIHTDVDTAKDVGLALAKGGIDFLNIIPTITAAVTDGALGQDLSNILREFSRGLSEEQSKYLKDQYSNITEKVDATYVANVLEAINSGSEEELGQIAESFLEETGVVLMEALRNPYVLMDLVPSEAIPFLAAGVVGKGVATQVAKGASKKGLTKEATEEAVERAATRAGIATGASEEGSASASEAYAEVMAMKPEELAKSDRYNELLNSLDPEDAHEQLAQEVQQESLLKGIFASGAISKVTRAGELSGNLLVGRPAKKGVIKGGLKGAGIESLEEGVQGPTVQALVNEVIQSEAKPDKEIRKGLGLEAGLGAVAGGVIGGTVGAISQAGGTKEDVTPTEVESVKETPVKEDLPEPENVVEKYSPERSPVKEEVSTSEELVRTVDLRNRYKKHDTDNTEVKEILSEATTLLESKGDLLSKVQLKDKFTDVNEVVEFLSESFVQTNELSDKALNLLQTNEDLSDNDKAVLNEIVEGTVGKQGSYNTISDVIVNLSSGALEETVDSIVSKQELSEEAMPEAEFNALIDTVGDIVLYSEDLLSNSSGKTLATLAQKVSDKDAKDLLNLAATLRGQDISTDESRQDSGIVRVAHELIGKGDQSITSHVDNFLKAVGKGDTAAARNIYDYSIGYLARTQRGKLASLEEALANPQSSGTQKVSWSTAGMASTSTSNSYSVHWDKPNAVSNLEKLITNVKNESTQLDAIELMAQKVLGTEPVQGEVTSQPEVSEEVQETVNSKVKDRHPLLKAVLDLGSLNVDEWASQGLDLKGRLNQGKNKQLGAGKPIFSNAGKVTPEDLLEYLEEQGYEFFDGDLSKVIEYVRDLFETDADILSNDEIAELEAQEQADYQEYLDSLDEEVTEEPEPTTIDELPNEGNIKEVSALIDSKIEGKPSAAKLIESGLFTKENATEWSVAYYRNKDGVAMESAYEERKSKVLDNYANSLESDLTTSELALIDAEIDSTEAFNEVPGVSIRPTGSIEEQTVELNNAEILLSEAQLINDLSTELDELSEIYLETTADVSIDVTPIKLKQQSTIKKLKEAKQDYQEKKDEYILAKNKYLEQEAKTIRLAEKVSSLEEAVELAKEGKNPYDPEAYNASHHSRANKIADVISIAKFNLDIFAKILDVPKHLLRDIVKGKTKSSNSVSEQLADLIRDKHFNGKSTDEVENYLTSVTSQLGELTNGTLKNSKGNLVQLGVRTKNKFIDRFNKSFPNLLSFMKPNKLITNLLGSLPMTSPLVDNLHAVKDTALWDDKSLFNLSITPSKKPNGTVQYSDKDTQTLQEFNEEHLDGTKESLFELGKLFADYDNFRSNFVDTILTSGGGIANEFIISETGKVPDYFVQSAFLAYSSIVANTGSSRFMDRNALKIYLEKIKGTEGYDIEDYLGKGNFITDEAIEGVLSRHNYLMENPDNAQSLPAINKFIASALRRQLHVDPNVEVIETIRGTGATGYGYVRKSMNTNSLLASGNIKVLNELYGVEVSRLNHIGSPPKTDYSHLPEKQREMAEITENTPYYFNDKVFEQMLSAVEGETIEAKGRDFAEKFLGSPTEAQLDILNSKDRLGQEGKKEGYIQEFVSAYNLYERLKAEGTDTPIHISSHFSLNGRQFFEGEVNPQGSKLHRILVRTSFKNQDKYVTHGSQKALITAFNKATGENKVRIEKYILAMGLGLGVSVDKQKNSISLKESRKKILQLSRDIKENNLKSVEHYINWKSEQDERFSPNPELIETLYSVFNGYVQGSLPLEVDGKTNGAFHANWLYGMAKNDVLNDVTNKELLNKGGLKDSATEQDTHWDNSSEDIYSAISDKATELVQDKLSSWDSKTVGIWNVLSDKSANIENDSFKRNFSKSGVTSTIYGGSANALNNGLIYGAKSGEGYLARLYSDVSDVLSNIHSKEDTTESINELLKWNALFDDEDKIVIPNNVDVVKFLKEFQLSDNQMNALKDGVSKTVGSAVSNAITAVMPNVKSITDEVTVASGTMIALYNLTLNNLVSHVRKKRKLGKWQTLSKNDELKIKTSLSKVFPKFEAATEGVYLLNKASKDHDIKEFTTVPSVAAGTGNASDPKNNAKIPAGGRPLGKAEVKATPHVIISVDGEMQRLTARMVKALTGTLQLNVLDAQDIASDAKTELIALVSNIAESIAIMTADPLANVSESLSRVVDGIKDPIKFEDDIVVTDLLSIITDDKDAITNEVLEVMQELSEELDGRTESNPYTPTMLAFVDSPKAFLEYLTKRMSQLSNDGQASRQKYLRDSDGIKVHQLAGIDGTGAIINSDGSFNWDLMKENSPNIRESDWVKLKNLPDVVAFEKASVEKMKEVIPTTSHADTAILEASNSFANSDLGQILIEGSKKAPINKATSVGYVEIKPTKGMIDKLNSRVQFFPKELEKMKLSLVGSNNDLDKVIIRVVDNANLAKFGLSNTNHGKYTTEKGKHVIYISEGLSARKMAEVYNHEVTHAAIENGLRASLATYDPKNVRSNEHKMIHAVAGDISKFMDIPVLDLYGNDTLVNLHRKLSQVALEHGLNTQNGMYVALQEYAAYLNQNPNDVLAYMSEDITHETYVNDSVKKVLINLFKRVGSLIKTIIGKGISWDKLGIDSTGSNPTLPHVSRAMLMQGFITAMTDRETNKKEGINKNISIKEVYSQSFNSVYDDKHADHLKELDSRISKSILNHRDSKDAKKLNDIANALATTNRTAKLSLPLAALGALDATQFEIFTKLTGVIEHGKTQKYYQKAHLDKLFHEVRNKLKPTDLLPEGIEPSDSNYQDELNVAKQVHKILFDSTDRHRTARFAAYVEVSPTMQKAVAKIRIDDDKDKVHKNKFEEVRHFVREAVVSTSDRIAKIPKGNLNSHTRKLVDQLILEETVGAAKRDSKLKEFERLVNSPLRKGIEISKNSIKYSVATITGNPKYKDGSWTEAILDYTPLKEGEVEPSGAIRKLLLEFLPRDAKHSQEVDRGTDIVKSNVDGERNGTVRAVTATLSEIFSTTLTDKENEAILEGDVRGDISSLIKSGYSLQDVIDLLDDPSKLDSKVRIARNTLLNTQVKDISPTQLMFMGNEAVSLGYRMVNGGATEGMNYSNAHNISTLTGSDMRVPNNNVDRVSTLVPVIDEIASLSALKYMPKASKETLSEIYKRELKADPNVNGITKLHTKLESIQEDLLERHGSVLFNQLPKGQLPDVNDPNRSVRVVAESELSKYPTYTTIRKTKVPHTSEPYYVIFDDVGGSVPYVSTGMSIIESSLEQQQKGTVRVGGLDYWESGKVTESVVSKMPTSMYSNMREPVDIKGGGLVPSFNRAGNISGYRYELPRAESKKLLDTSSEWVDVVANYSGRVVEEASAASYNNELVESLHRVYSKELPSERENAWVKVHSKSPFKQVREGWELMPTSMKQHAKEVFGEDAIYVHRDDLDQVIGYRERSITNLFRPENYEEDSHKRAISKVLKEMFGKDVIHFLRKSEMITQELVTGAKDLITVKSVVVPAGNIVSNVNQLVLRGVPIQDIQKNMLLGVHAKRDFDKVTEQLYRLRESVSIEKDEAEKARLTEEFNIIKLEREANPLYRLIVEEGLNPAVIEELGEEAKRGVYKQKMLDKLTPTNELPDNGLVDVGKEVIITQDSSLYKLLNESLELGDFVSKFVLYTHLTEVEGVSHRAAVEQARSEFINYNRAQSRELDYLNKTGMMFFSKYLFRKHPIIARSIEDNPSRAVTQVMSMGLLGLPSIYETSIFTKDLLDSTGTIDLLGMGGGAHPWMPE